MEYFEEIYYDSHIKAHERYLLIAMLEDAKNEKINKLKEEAVPVPTKKVNVPSPDIKSGSLSFSQAFDSKLLDVSGCLITKPQQKAVSYKPTVDFTDLSEKIKPNTVIPEKSSLDIKPTISSEIFENIELHNIAVSDSSIDTKLIVDPKAFDGIMTENDFSVPANTDISKPFSIPDDFGIDKVDVSIKPTVDIDGVVFVNKDSFKNINTVKAEQFDLHNTAHEALIQVDKTRFEGIIPQISDKIELLNKDKAVFDKSSLKSISMKKISVPEKTKETVINIIDEKLFSDVMPAKAASLPKKVIINTDVAALKPDLSINCSVKLPESVDLSMKPSMPKIGVKIDSQKLLSKTKKQDTSVNIKLPSVRNKNIEVPKAPVLPKADKIDKASLAMPKVIKPEKIQVPKVGQAAKLSIVLPEPIAIEDTAKRVSDFKVPLSDFSINSVKTAIPDNSDILEMASKEKTMYSNP